MAAPPAPPSATPPGADGQRAAPGPGPGPGNPGTGPDEVQRGPGGGAGEAGAVDGRVPDHPAAVCGGQAGVADLLAEGPCSGPELAEAVGADPDLLTRVLRGLALEEVLAEVDGGRFALTELGQCLRGDVAGSIRGPMAVRGELYYQAAAGMLAAVRLGGTAFEQVYRDRFFAYLSRHPEQEAVFQRSMAGRSEQEAGDVVAAYDFGGLGRLVDVGGGYGILLEAILRAAPSLRAVLVDQPAGADAYLLSRVLHDWVDDDARRLLATCRSAMGPGSRLLVVEALLPERAADQPAVIRMDLHMLVLLGARERTEAQFRRLLAETGFEVRRVVPTRSPAGLSVLEAVPAHPEGRAPAER
jgi:hypothetical protein